MAAFPRVVQLALSAGGSASQPLTVGVEIDVSATCFLRSASISAAVGAGGGGPLGALRTAAALAASSACFCINFACSAAILSSVIPDEALVSSSSTQRVISRIWLTYFPILSAGERFLSICTRSSLYDPATAALRSASGKAV